MTDVAKVAAPSQKRSRNPVTYGEAQEEAAQALNQLIVFDDPPIEPGDVDLLLQCREGVISAVHQRLFALGLERVPLVKSTEVSCCHSHSGRLPDQAERHARGGRHRAPSTSCAAASPPYGHTRHATWAPDRREMAHRFRRSPRRQPRARLRSGPAVET